MRTRLILAGALAALVGLVGAMALICGTYDASAPAVPSTSTTTTAAPCVPLVPDTDDDIDPDGAAFERWAAGRLLDYRHGGTWVDETTGETVGYGAAEDSPVYASAACADAQPTYPTTTYPTN